MKSARERAIDIVFEYSGSGFSRAMFVKIMQDDSDAGRAIARLVAAVERGIEADRAAAQKAAAPS